MIVYVLCQYHQQVNSTWSQAGVGPKVVYLTRFYCSYQVPLILYVFERRNDYYYKKYYSSHLPFRACTIVVMYLVLYKNSIAKQRSGLYMRCSSYIEMYVVCRIYIKSKRIRRYIDKVHKYIHTYSISIEDENNTQITASFYL